MIYDLVGDNRISGKFEGEVFIVESDVDTFINVLDAQFKSWEDKEKQKEGKI